MVCVNNQSIRHAADSLAVPQPGVLRDRRFGGLAPPGIPKSGRPPKAGGAKKTAKAVAGAGSTVTPGARPRHTEGQAPGTASPASEDNAQDGPAAARAARRIHAGRAGTGKKGVAAQHKGAHLRLERDGFAVAVLSSLSSTTSTTSRPSKSIYDDGSRVLSLIDSSAMERFDPSGMHKVYDRWPEIACEAYESDIEPADFEDIDHVVFSGMGGSGAVGDLFASVLSRTAVHVTVVKGYLLPRTADDRTLVVCTSVSGDTAETLAVAGAAGRLGCRLIGFSSGGRLERFCGRDRSPAASFRKVRAFLNPRSSFASFVYSMIKAMGPILPIGKGDVSESLRRMSALCGEVGSANLGPSNPSLRLAQWVRGGIPLAYYPWGLQAAAIRFKNSVQENMKSHAITEDVIEASHNGIVSWEGGSRAVVPVIISGQDDYASTKERWDVLREFFSQSGIDYREVRSGGGSILTKIVGLVYQLDFATIYGAVLNGTDPVPVPSIDFVKERT